MVRIAQRRKLLMFGDISIELTSDSQYAELVHTARINEMDAQQPVGSPFWRTAGGLAAIAFGAVAAFFLFTEHRAHMFGLLPYLFLLACPVMMLFMHHGHGGHDHHDHSPSESEPPQSQGRTQR